MNYRILGEPMELGCTNYQGLYREGPMYLERSEFIEKVYDLWGWYADQTGDGGFITDISKGKELIKGYKGLGINFDLIRTDTIFQLFENEEYLGIDVCSLGGYSLLPFGLNYKENSFNRLKIGSIYSLIQCYFQPKINKYCLFNDQCDASFFLEVITEIMALCPGVLEKENYQLFFLYKVIDCNESI